MTYHPDSVLVEKVAKASGNQDRLPWEAISGDTEAGR